MTKYGHKSGCIAISRLRAWIVDKLHISKKNINGEAYQKPIWVTDPVVHRFKSRE